MEDTHLPNSLFSLTPKKGLAIALGITLLATSPTLFNGWVNWDDDFYVLTNPLVRDVSWEQIKNIFSTLQVQGNYHPITVVSLAIDYALAGTDPFIYHLTNLVLHLCNVGLVFGFIYLLTGRLYMAIIASLLFGIHPMHVESVAWISQRKDVLYTSFFMLGLILYLFYLTKNSHPYRWLGLCLASFVLSLLSKGMAVTFPLILVLIDYVYQRTDYQKVILEKIPFLVLSLVFGIITIKAQQASKAVIDTEAISWIDSVLVACYGLTLYPLKALIPFRLSVLHPYPMEHYEPLPGYFYVFAGIAMLLLGLSWWGIRKHRLIAFGIAFFILSILPVLQLLPVGVSIIAERYTYVSYMGLFMLMGLGVEGLIMGRWKLSKNRRTGLLGLTGVFLVTMMGITLNRIQVWKNGETLWSDVIQKYPDHYFGYACRGLYWTENGQPQKALEDFNQTLQRNPRFADGYINRGCNMRRQENTSWPWPITVRPFSSIPSIICLISIGEPSYISLKTIRRHYKISTVPFNSIPTFPHPITPGE